VGIDSGSDYLLAVIHAHYFYGCSPGSSRLWMKGSLGNLIPGLLVRSDRHSMGFEEVTPDCVDYLLTLCDDFKSSPLRLQRLLVVLTQADLGYHGDWCDPDKLRVVVKLVKEGQIFGDGTTSRRYCKRLAQSITVSRNKFLCDWWQYQDGEMKPYAGSAIEFDRDCEEAIELLLKNYSESVTPDQIESLVDENALDEELQLWTGREYTGTKLAEMMLPFWMEERRMRNLADNLEREYN
jgi:hypothetical protein